MSVLTRIINGVNIAVVRFGSSTDYTMSVYRIHSRDMDVDLLDDDAAKDSMSKYPTMLMVCGYGVIIKKDDDGNSETIQKVKTEQDTFQWNYSPDKADILFVRQSQIEHVKEDDMLQAGKIISVKCFIDNGEELSSALESHARIFFRESINLGNIVRPTETGSYLAQLTLRKIRVPVLCLLLLLLTANYFISERVNEKYSVQHYELDMVRKSKGQAEKNSRIREQAIAGYGKTIPLSYSWLCDMIGSVTPEEIVLTSLSFQPVMKPLENNKWPVLAEREIRIKGKASNPDIITTMISALWELSISGDVRLVSVDKERGSGKSVFQISITV